MSCCREGFNLFDKDQRDNFFSKKYKPWGLMFIDTFMPLVCKVIGHKPYNAALFNEKEEIACKRCSRWL